MGTPPVGSPRQLHAANRKPTAASLGCILLQAVHILETYFDIDEGEDQNLAPAVDSQVRDGMLGLRVYLGHAIEVKAVSVYGVACNLLRC